MVVPGAGGSGNGYAMGACSGMGKKLQFALRARLSPQRSIGGNPARMNAELSRERERSEYSISELAREFDVTPRAIRFYEDHGLLAPKRDGQRRIYSPRDRTRLKLTLRGKRLGLTLSEIRELIDMYEPGRDERPQLERFLAVLQAHTASLLQQRGDIEAQLSELQAFEKKIKKQLKGN